MCTLCNYCSVESIISHYSDMHVHKWIITSRCGGKLHQITMKQCKNVEEYYMLNLLWIYINYYFWQLSICNTDNQLLRRFLRHIVITCFTQTVFASLTDFISHRCKRLQGMNVVNKTHTKKTAADAN